MWLDFFQRHCYVRRYCGYESPFLSFPRRIFISVLCRHKHTHTPAVCMASRGSRRFLTLYNSKLVSARGLSLEVIDFSSRALEVLPKKRASCGMKKSRLFDLCRGAPGISRLAAAAAAAHSAPSQSSQKFCSHKVTSRQIYIGVRMLFGLQSEN